MTATPLKLNPVSRRPEWGGEGWWCMWARRASEELIEERFSAGGLRVLNTSVTFSKKQTRQII